MPPYCLMVSKSAFQAESGSSNLPGGSQDLRAANKCVIEFLMVEVHGCARRNSIGPLVPSSKLALRDISLTGKARVF